MEGAESETKKKTPPKRQKRVIVGRDDDDDGGTDITVGRANLALFAAARSGNVETAGRLLDGNAVANWANPTKDRQTPLHAATMAGHAAVVAVLLQRGGGPARHRWEG